MDKGKTINEVVNSNLCTGCATCISLCPCNAIELVKNDLKGIYLPHIKVERCNQCGICFEVCPGHTVDFASLNKRLFGQEAGNILIGNYLNCYLGYATDYEIRYHSASGGLVTSLLIFALEEGIIDGALVIGVKKDNPIEPRPFIARTPEEIMSAATSKYCPVPANIALKEILHNKGKYAVVGLPCHLHGIRKAEMINKKLCERIIFHVGIFCGQTMSFLGTEFLLRDLKIREDDIQSFNYRGEGWPGFLNIRMKNSRPTILKSYLKYYDIRLSSFVPWRCTLCPDLVSELADISFGDAWLPNVVKSDKVGTSVIISRNKMANEVLEKMVQAGKIKLVLVDDDLVAKSQGGVFGKKRDLSARLRIARWRGRKLPVYPGLRLLPLSFKVYFSSAVIISLNFLASKHYLWPLLNVASHSLKYGSCIKSRLIRLFSRS